MKSKKINLKYFNQLRARFSLDDGFAERPLYSIKAMTTEKNKGINMLELIEDHFNISKQDREKAFTAKMNEINEMDILPAKSSEGFKSEKIKWTRDEKGNLASPFRTKKEK